MLHLCCWDSKTTCWSSLWIASLSPILNDSRLRLWKSVISLFYICKLHYPECVIPWYYSMVLPDLKPKEMRVTTEWPTDTSPLWPPSSPKPVHTSPSCAGVVGLLRVWIVLGCRSSAEASCPEAVNYRCPLYQPKGGHYPNQLTQRQSNPNARNIQ